MTEDNHPRSVLLGAQARTGIFAGVRPLQRHPQPHGAKHRLQEELTREFGACVMDVTLDCEDGAPVGREAAHAALVAELVVNSAQVGAGGGSRACARSPGLCRERPHPAAQGRVIKITSCCPKLNHWKMWIAPPSKLMPPEITRTFRCMFCWSRPW